MTAAARPTPGGATDVVVIGGSRWSEEVNQPAQQAAAALADAGHRVFYLYREVQSSALRNLIEPIDERGRGRAIREVVGRRRFEPVAARLWATPLRGLAAALPLSHPEPWRRVLAGRLRRWLAAEERRLEMRSPLYWFYWWCFPELAETAPGGSVYDIIDEHASYEANTRWKRANRKVAALEGRLLRAVDRAYAVSAPLVERRREAAVPIALLPNGISLGRARAALAPAGAPAGAAGLKRPLIGYVGDVGTRLDWDLIDELAAARPAWTFAFVGGPGPDRLARRANVRMLPGCSYAEALRYMHAFDVAILPLRATDFTRAISSLKLLDYLAAGRLPVASDLPFVRQLADRWPQLVSIADGRDAWLAAIEARLAAPAEAAETAREEALRARSVEARIARVLGDLNA